MNKNNRQGLTGLIIFIIVLSVGLYFFLKTHNKEKQIVGKGTEITATVYSNFREKSVRGTKIWVSEAVYEVDKRSHKYITEVNVPVGTEFKIKYLPDDPSHVVLVNPDQFKKHIAH